MGRQQMISKIHTQIMETFRNGWSIAPYSWKLDQVPFLMERLEQFGRLQSLEPEDRDYWAEQAREVKAMIVEVIGT